VSAINDRELERRIGELHALTEVAKTLTAPLELPGLLGAVMDKLENVLEPAEVGAILLWDQSSGLFRAEAAFGYDLEILHEVGLRDGESITGKVYDAGTACLLSTPQAVALAMEDIRPANRAALVRALGTRATPIGAVAAPLRVGEQRFGVLVLETLRGPACFTEGDVPFVQTLADLIALAIDGARLELEAAATRDARQVDRLRSEVMATLSHELRTPLAAIRGYATALMLDEITWPEEKRREFLRLIDDECENLQRMISDILDSSLIDVGQLAIEHQPVRLTRLAREVADEMQRRTEIHRVVLDFTPRFPIVDADPHRIKQVIRNILDNAIKYIENVQERTIVTEIDIGKNIEDILKTIDSLFFVTGADISPVRQKIDDCLEIWESRWYSY